MGTSLEFERHFPEAGNNFFVVRKTSLELGMNFPGARANVPGVRAEFPLELKGNFPGELTSSSGVCPYRIKPPWSSKETTQKFTGSYTEALDSEVREQRLWRSETTSLKLGKPSLKTRWTSLKFEWTSLWFGRNFSEVREKLPWGLGGISLKWGRNSLWSSECWFPDFRGN